MTRFYVMRGPSSSFDHFVDSDDLDRSICGRPARKWIVVPTEFATCPRCNERRNKNA